MSDNSKIDSGVPELPQQHLLDELATAYVQALAAAAGATIAVARDYGRRHSR